MSLDTELVNDPKGTALKYSFLPANAAAGYDASIAELGKWLNGDFGGFRHTVVNSAQKVARVSLTRANSNRGEVVLVTPSLTATTGVPVYFLPWDGRGAAVELTIPDRDPALSTDQHPKIFFTAVLSGCTIFFKGSARNPTIFHCGTEGATGGGLPTVGDSNKFFKRMLRTAEAQNVGTAGPIVGKVKSTDYMVRPASPNTSPHIQALEASAGQALRQRYRNQMDVQGTIGWGSVLGVRTGRAWKFYVQRNITIVWQALEDYLQSVRQKRLGGLITVNKNVAGRRAAGPVRQESKPIEVQRVFPGTGVAKMPLFWRSMIG